MIAFVDSGLAVISRGQGLSILPSSVLGSFSPSWDWGTAGAGLVFLTLLAMALSGALIVARALYPPAEPGADLAWRDAAPRHPRSSDTLPTHPVRTQSGPPLGPKPRRGGPDSFGGG